MEGDYNDRLGDRSIAGFCYIEPRCAYFCRQGRIIRFSQPEKFRLLYSTVIRHTGELQVIFSALFTFFFSAFALLPFI